MKKIVLASNNAHKVIEYREILSPLGYEVVTPKDLGVHSDPEENGTTFHENSYIKAKALRDLVDYPVISDDSGFQVKALNGFPGLYSSRFAGEHGNDYAKAGHALNDMLKPNDSRDCSFHCTICLLLEKDSEPIYFDGDCYGALLSDPHGANGFGYDPFFHSSEIDKDFGLVPEETKNQYSHRAKALAKLLVYFQNN